MNQQGYIFGSPSIVLYGENALQGVGEQIKQRGVTKALLISDNMLSKLGQIKKVTNILEESGIQSVVYSEVNSEPTDIHVHDGLDILRKNQCDVVVALGGGSPMDAAKAISILATNPGNITDYEGRNIVIPNRKMLLVAIGTTAGTGSEVSQAAIITDTKRTVKMVIKNEMVRPDIAVCDPLLTTSMPPSVTAATGMDALTHAIEGYVNRSTQPMVEIFALEAIRLISTSLPKAWANGADLEARDNMMRGQLLAGFAFSISATGTVHGLARPFGAHFHISHGLSNAIFLPIGMQFTMPAVPEKFVKIAEAMGENVQELTMWEGALKAVEAAKKLQKMICIPSLHKCGIDTNKYKDLINQMAEDGIASGSHRLNPRTPNKEDLAKLYELALED